jgi:uncharacterized protein (DUF2249 family)/hemerythrin-like domain-containing protein
MAKSTLDVRPLAVEQQDDALLGAFDVLSPGDAVLLVAGEPPRRILQRLQRDRVGQFEWNPVELGPARWRIVIQRPEAPARSVSEFVGHEHQRLTAMFTAIASLVAEARCMEAASAYLEFRCAVIRHLEAEEQILYPRYEKVTGISGGATADLRAQHVTIRRLMDDLARAIDGRQQDECRRIIDVFAALLATHTEKEEQIICRETDRAAADAATGQSIISALQSL